MSLRREDIVRTRLEHLLETLRDSESPTIGGVSRLARVDALACIEAAYVSRLLDFEARDLKNAGLGFYTIGSAGHEGNAVLGHLLRTDDPSLLHYRSGALVMARLAKLPGETPIYDTLLSFLASREDPVSGGRHKVWGSLRAWIPPQTSTIASQLPKAVGMAFALERERRLRTAPTDAPRVRADSIVCVSFGDASCNHASAQTAFNAAAWATLQRLPVPVLFVCEDNGIGISVHTPDGWIRSQFAARRGIDYFEADGGDLEEAYTTAERAIEHCRRTRRPTFLRLRVVRLLGHAGSDVESLYHSEAQIEAAESRDPLLRMSRDLVDRGLATGVELHALWHETKARIGRVRDIAVQTPRLESTAEVARDLLPPDASRVQDALLASKTSDSRVQRWGGHDKLPESDRPRHMAMQLSRALVDLMHVHPEILVFGEDVAKKGGVYHVTTGLYEKYGVGRVFNTLLDETMILGTAIGAAQLGFLPMPEIQYLAYLHNAEDQLRGEACSQRFFSDGQWDNPMVVRIAGLAYQKGFGGHFHNDNSIGVLRDIPGIVLAVPSRGDDAVRMLRACVAAAKFERRVCVFLEPIALYMTKDLYDKGDAAWSFAYPPPGDVGDDDVVFGTPRTYDADSRTPGGAELPKILCVTYGNGVPMSLRARREVAADVTVVDLRWLAPLPIDAVLRSARRMDALLVVDECRRTGGGVAEAILAAVAEDPESRHLKARRVVAEDSYVPLGPADRWVLPQEEEIVEALESLTSDLSNSEPKRVRRR
ncbi:MAG: MFS transporter [Planctomycetes bacterium]|nr:MFS transporter [Planctomycetota bacterium]